MVTTSYCNRYVCRRKPRAGVPTGGKAMSQAAQEASMEAGSCLQLPSAHKPTAGDIVLCWPGEWSSGTPGERARGLAMRTRH